MFNASVLESITDINLLTDMLRAEFSLEDWDAMVHIADKLHHSIKELYEEDQLRQAKGQPRVDTRRLKRSIAFYFGYAMVMKGIALQKMGDYAAARDCIEKYTELGWIYGLDEEGQADVAHFRMFARANTYVLDLLEGKMDTLPEYVQFIHQSEEELLPGTITILEAAIKYDYNVDWALKEFEPTLDSLDGEYETEANIRYYIDHLYLMALYNLKNGKYSNALNIVLKALRMSDKLKDDTGFKKINALFISFSEHASKEQLNEYNVLNKTILERVLKDEKGIMYDGSSFVSAR
ncbi:DNA-binding protein [Paenibacillus brasilensis]|uniref:Tetratricopeptide (TPR) repeat protein n=1 Tax=Paenibacillus brasilensis TaxID=128574 RepID=A0ABU0L0V6_9BACL|nr:DNA-binding protein [Paenibacillus brasilensis]MDQ0495321.1 tetratricopeptide (TPR) repeat protein [Paenibacillus brasilensis]